MVSDAAEAELGVFSMCDRAIRRTTRRHPETSILTRGAAITVAQHVRRTTRGCLRVCGAAEVRAAQDGSRKISAQLRDRIAEWRSAKWIFALMQLESFSLSLDDITSCSTAARLILLGNAGAAFRCISTCFSRTVCFPCLRCMSCMH